MEFFFSPQAVAVIGATPNRAKGGYAIVRNLIRGFKGKIYPINPKYPEIDGIPCYPSIAAVPGPIDMAIVFVPARQVPAAVEQCAAKGIKGVIIESGGFAETGPEGQSLQQALIDTAKKTGIRLWGPNCMGLVDAVNQRAFSFMNPRALEAGLVPGTVSLVVQSGMLSAGFLMDIMSHGIMGISKVCSIGNKIDVNECDLLKFFLKDPDTKVVGFYLESIPEGRRFIELCRRSDKPIVVLKGGKSRMGAEAAKSHTASLAGNSRVVTDTLAQAGVTEAKDFKQMMDLCRTLALVPPPRKKQTGRIAILTFSGGAGIVSADFLEELGLSVAELSEKTKKELEKLYPEWMPVANPVDLWPAMERHGGTEVDVATTALKVALDDPNVDGVFLHAFAGNVRIRFDMERAAEFARAAGKPVFIWLIGVRDDIFGFQTDALAQGIPVFQEVYRAVECMAAAFHQRRPEERIKKIPRGEKVVLAKGL
ncbi:MAG: CoA-binding protein, partial [Smithellaceae bacterium]|nr:CoA-binding protein [Smithellaceae bacterium]